MNDKHTPSIIGFLCTWCSYTGADLAGTARMRVPSSFRVIRVMCSGRIDPLFVLKAFLKGADGIMMMGCHPGDCHYQKGNYSARRRFVMLQNILDTLGLEKDRIGLWWVSASEAPRYAQVTTEFAEKVKEFGPNPLREEIFL
ncbi:MAG: hydrogenase iron-sulfur subunit [Candidatus Aminicenantes bacterium]|nr:hydrogenase iron-sulfur subunit [Candidatus Aminicenantes bacterium]